MRTNLYPLQRVTQTHQTHTVVIDAAVLHTKRTTPSEGDALMTNIPYVPLAVMTADCIPIALYDSRNHSCALIHAGWRGLTNDIIEKTITRMRELYGTHATHLHAYIGPAARACCYEVSTSWVNTQLPQQDHKVLAHNQNGTYFDLPTAAQNRLVTAGLLPKSINMTKVCCTICSNNHWSYRREKMLAQRNVTICFFAA